MKKLKIYKILLSSGNFYWAEYVPAFSKNDAIDFVASNGIIEKITDVSKNFKSRINLDELSYIVLNSELSFDCQNVILRAFRLVLDISIN